MQEDNPKEKPDQNHTELTDNFSVAKELHQGFCLADVIVEPDLGVVIRHNERHHLAPKAMEILVFLAAQHCEIVSREQILTFGWGDLTASKTNITHIISEIRHVLDDHKECPTYIQTIPRKGYRMMVPATKKPDLGLFGFTEQATSSSKYKLSISILRSRRLFKSSATYLIVSWVLLQVFAMIFPIFNAPSWSIKFATLILIIGFPIIIGFQWFEEVKKKQALAKNGATKGKLLYLQLAVDSVFVLIVLSSIYFLSGHLITNIEQTEELPVPQQTIEK